MPQFLQRAFVVLLLKIVDYAMASDSINELKRSGRRENRVRYDVKMIRHDHMSIQSKLARPPRLVQGRTGDALNFIGAKDR
jgi:hypothetical protein